MYEAVRTEFSFARGMSFYLGGDRLIVVVVQYAAFSTASSIFSTTIFLLAQDNIGSIGCAFR